MKKNKLIPLILSIVIVCCIVVIIYLCFPKQYTVTFYRLTYYEDNSRPVIFRLGARQIPAGGVIGAATYDDGYVGDCRFKGWYVDQSLTETWNINKDRVYANISLYAYYEEE